MRSFILLSALFVLNAAAPNHFTAQVEKIVKVEEQYLHDRGVLGLSVDDAERQWAATARARLMREQAMLQGYARAGLISEKEAKATLNESYYAVLEAAVVVEGELKAHHIIAQDHIMPLPRTAPAPAPTRTYRMAAPKPKQLYTTRGSRPPSPGRGRNEEVPDSSTRTGSREAAPMRNPREDAMAALRQRARQAELHAQTQRKHLRGTSSGTGSDTSSETRSDTSGDTSSDISSATSSKNTGDSRGDHTAIPSAVTEAETAPAVQAAAPTSTNRSSDELGLGAFVGLIVGGVALVVLAAAGVVVVHKKCSRQTAQQRLTEARESVTVVQVSSVSGTGCTASPTSDRTAVQHTNFVQML